MADDVFDLNDTGMLELAKRLEAYADARLSPSIASTSRMRTSVMNAAHRRAARGTADSTFGAAGATTATIATPAAERRSASARTWRRPVVAILAATLAVAMLAGTVSASKPGGPLYATRLWIEMANLPADVVARAQAEINRLDARIQEAQQASAAGDGPATSAALTAYSVIVVEAARGSAGDPTASAAIEATVTRHVVILTLMVDSVPSPARDAVQDALSSSTTVLTDLDGAQSLDSRDGPTRVDRSKSATPTGAEGENPNRAADPPTKRDATSDEETVAPDRHATPEKATTGSKPADARGNGRQGTDKGAATAGGAGSASGANGGAGSNGGASYEDRAATPTPKRVPHDPNCPPSAPPDAGAT
jgi:hypothetical protein